VSGTLQGIGAVGSIAVDGGGVVEPGLTSAAAQALGYLVMPLAGGGYVADATEVAALTADSVVAAQSTSSTPDLVSSPGGAGASADAISLVSSEPQAGALTVAGNVTLSGSSVFSIRLGVNTAGDHDELNVTNGGAVSLDGATLQLTLGSVINNTANIGLTYVIINGGATDTGSAFSNTFAQGSSINVPGGFVFDILYASNPAGNGPGSDVVLELAQVPEPGSWLLMLLFTPLVGFVSRRGRL
jgi:hypothetical protein